MLDEYVKQLSEALQLETPIRSEAEGVYALMVDEDVEVIISDLAPGFGFQCAVAPCPEKNEEEFLTQAMLANLFGQGTEGAVLGLDETGKVLTLAAEHAGGSYKIFEEGLEDFINAVEFWRTEARNTAE